MAVTNEPVLQNKTGLVFLQEMKKTTGFLSILAEGKRGQIYQSMAQIANIVRGNSVEMNKKLFPVGDQIITPWKDIQSTDHDTDETAYQVAWDIVHHEIVTLRDGSQVPGMYLQMHKCSAFGIQFSHRQAFYQASTAPLPAGMYSVTFGVDYNSTYPAGSSAYFTLPYSLPVGGKLTFTNSYNYVEMWTTGIEPSSSSGTTIAMRPGKFGTDLGTITSAVSGNLNAMDRVLHGHNRWSTSGIRQYLNSDSGWLVNKEDFFIRSDRYYYRGFMSGFNSDFLDAIKPVRVITALNTVGEYSDTVEETFDTFFLPSLEQMNVQPQLIGAEGKTFDYWKRALGSPNFVGTDSANTYDAFMIPAINDTSAQNVRLRSANRNSMGNTFLVNSSGFVTNDAANSEYRFSPVCVVC